MRMAHGPVSTHNRNAVNAAPPVDGEITNALGYVPADRAGDHFTGPVDCGPHQTIGGPLENMAKHSENFAAAAWDKNGGSCSVTSNAIIAPVASIAFRSLFPILRLPVRVAASIFPISA